MNKNEVTRPSRRPQTDIKLCKTRSFSVSEVREGLRGEGCGPPHRQLRAGRVVRSTPARHPTRPPLASFPAKQTRRTDVKKVAARAVRCGAPRRRGRRVVWFLRGVEGRGRPQHLLRAALWAAPSLSSSPRYERSRETKRQVGKKGRRKPSRRLAHAPRRFLSVTSWISQSLSAGALAGRVAA